MKQAIRVENLGKCYRVAHQQQRAGYRTLRDSLVEAAKAPFRRWFGGDRSAESAEDFWALKDVSFEVKPGEVVGIIGRNGAGKSTLLKILSRITKPTKGRVELNGRVGSLLEVGTGFHPELTGRENIYLNGSILGMSRKEIAQKFDAIVGFSGIEAFLDVPVKRYSSGMYVRLAFAVAAHLELEILVVDEVLAVGDMEFQKRCLGKMQDVTKSGRTVLFVSHNMAAVRALCSKGIFLERGSVQRVDNIESIIDLYHQSQTDSGLAVNSAKLPCVSREGDLALTELSLSQADTGLVVKLALQATRRFPLIGLGFALRTLEGVVLTTQGPPVNGMQLSNVNGRLDLSVLVHDVFRSLSGGTYSIDLWVSYPGIEYILYLETAARFDVPERDPYGHGHALSQRIHGPCHLTASMVAAPRPQEANLIT